MHVQVLGYVPNQFLLIYSRPLSNHCLSYQLQSKISSLLWNIAKLKMYVSFLLYLTCFLFQVTPIIAVPSLFQFSVAFLNSPNNVQFLFDSYKNSSLVTKAINESSDLLWMDCSHAHFLPPFVHTVALKISSFTSLITSKCRLQNTYFPSHLPDNFRYLWFYCWLLTYAFSLAGLIIVKVIVECLWEHKSTIKLILIIFQLCVNSSEFRWLFNNSLSCC